ncbi:proteasomal ubiquitin receptor ADRM1-like isoform X1 [Dermacentor andersoni]|uniref:proteasomal ubiquitin receptor ADRM1-like isoform X1 n=1 Tax=Dermacentor andersoni TaxID=34620 RepID=UPI0021553CA9|nr:proteasomal ubiquitin receptor ADRM1-B-like isoform X1 [Dermacentor andersoni]
MTRGLLFGSTSGNQNHSKYLVEFRAGRMTRKGNMVHPDKRKGTVYVHQSEDSLMHFCWKDRTTGSVEDDLIIFPDDAEFKKVTQCTTGRVYVLKFKSSSRRCFYWMQEPKEDKDDELVRKVNEYLNNPPVPGSSRGAGSSGAGGSGSHLHSELPNIGDDDLQNLLNNMSQTQLVQLLGGIGGVGGVANLTSLLGGGRSGSQSGTPASAGAAASEAVSATTVSPPSQSTAASSTAAATATTDTTAAAASTPTTTAGSSSGGAAASGPAIQLSDLQSILSGIKVPPSESTGAEASKEQSVNVDLSTAINMEVLQPLLDNKELMSRVEKLLPATIESGKQPDVSELLQDTIKSPQFQQALSMFSTALQSGQLGPLMQQFGMDDSVVAAANSGDMAQFVKALQASKAAKDAKSPKKDENVDEDMGLD